MKVYDEMIHAIEGVRMQCIKWRDMIWNIYCNDRFKPNDFTVKVHCEICGPEVFVPKVFEYRSHRICTSCLTRFVEMMQTAMLADCGRDRHEVANLEQKLIAIEIKKKEMKNV
jgi:hypothetical protein